MSDEKNALASTRSKGNPKFQNDASPEKHQQEHGGTWPKIAVDYDNEEYELRKRLPVRFPLHKNDVYITRRTNFKAQLERCRKLLDAGFTEIYIHGLGTAVNRAINLALQLKRRGLGTLDIATNTSTMEVTDDLLPLLDDLEPKTRVRYVSAIHIKLFLAENPVTNF